jgi:hypothetical protein
LRALFLLSTAGGAVEGDGEGVEFNSNAREELFEALIESLIINGRYGRGLEIADA